MRPIAFVFYMKQCLVVPYKSPANNFPVLQIGYAPVVFSSHRQIMGKTLRIFSKAMWSKIQVRYIYSSNTLTSDRPLAFHALSGSNRC